MTDSYAIWKPEHDGHAPPNWREGMPWVAYFREQLNPHPIQQGKEPAWDSDYVYYVPAEALNSPNDDAPQGFVKLDEFLLKQYVEYLREYPAETLAKHGITLAPEKDVFVELFADVLDAWGVSAWNVSRIRSTTDHSWRDEAAIELLRQRFEQMKGAR